MNTIKEINNLKELLLTIETSYIPFVNNNMRKIKINESFISNCELVVKMKSIADAPFCLRGFAAIIPLFIVSIKRFILFDILKILNKKRCILKIDDDSNYICIYITNGETNRIWYGW